MLRTTVAVVMTAINTTYRGKGPSNPLGAVPYSVVYGGGIDTDGPTSAPWSDLDTEVHVKSVGETSEQAEGEADRVFAALIGVALSPPSGRAWLRPNLPAGHVFTREVERDEDFGPETPLFYVDAFYDLPTTPA